MTKQKKNSKKNKKVIYKKKKTKKMFLKDQSIVYDYGTNVGVAIGQKASVGIRQNQHIKDGPYFKHENILIYKDDILKINSIPENSVDLIITSPPYNVDIHYCKVPCILDSMSIAGVDLLLHSWQLPV